MANVRQSNLAQQLKNNIHWATSKILQCSWIDLITSSVDTLKCSSWKFLLLSKWICYIHTFNLSLKFSKCETNLSAAILYNFEILLFVFF